MGNDILASIAGLISIVCHSNRGKPMPMTPNLFFAVLDQEAQAVAGRAERIGPRLAAHRERAAVPSRAPVTVRFGTPADAREIGHIADLDSSSPPQPPLLVGERGTQLVAALSLRDGDLVANPFVPTADLVAILRLRARQLRRERGEPAAWRRRASAVLRPRRATAH
jgi:hypothetical protein